MGSTTASGFRYPVATDTPDVPRDIKALADDLEAFLGPIVPYATAAGQLSVNGTGVVAGGNVQTALTFPAGRFTQIPRVYCSLSNAPSSSSYLVARLVPSSTTAGTLWVLNVGQASFTWTGLTVDWFAVQMLSGASSG